MAEPRALSPTREREERGAERVSGKVARGELKKFGESLAVLVESAKELHRVHATTAGAKLAASLAAFGERADQDGVDMKDIYLQAAGALRQIASCQATYQQHLESGFITPLEKFVRSELKALGEAEKRLAKAREDYDSVQIKADQSRMKKSDKTNKMEAELAEAQKSFEMAEINFLNKAFAVDARKQFEVSERVCDLLLAQMVVHKLSYDILKGLEPQLHDAKQKIAESRDNFVSKVAPGRVEEMRTVPLNKAVSQPDAPMKQGYVHVNGKRRWVTVADGLFSIYKSWKDMNASGAADVQDTVDLKLCSVKKLELDPKDKEKDKDRQAFSLISPERTLTIDVSEASEMDEWMTVIRNTTTVQLKKRTGRPVSPAARDGGASNATDAARNNPSGVPATPTVTLVVPSPSSIPTALTLVRNASPANLQCADCSSKDPEWAAYNLGAIVCNDCSGVHRSLGTHISRVRSLTLDHWEPGQLFLLKQFGNAVAKDIWESIPPAEEKLSEVADRTARERYITAKYVQRKYVQRPASLVDDEVRYAALQAAAMANDYVGVLRLLAQGADPNRSSMLALLTQDPSVSPHTIELLLQNNAKAGAADERGWTALHYAAKVDNLPAAAVLLRYNAPLNAETDEKKTPAAIAAQSASHAVGRLLTAATENSNRAPSPRQVSIEASPQAKPQSGKRIAFEKNHSASALTIPEKRANTPLASPSSSPPVGAANSSATNANNSTSSSTNNPAQTTPSILTLSVPSAHAAPASPTHPLSATTVLAPPSGSNPRRLVMRDKSPPSPHHAVSKALPTAPRGGESKGEVSHSHQQHAGASPSRKEPKDRDQVQQPAAAANEQLSPRKWLPYVNATSPEQQRLVRQKEVLQEGLEVLKQHVASIRSDLADSKLQDEATMAELTRRLRTARAIMNGEIEGDAPPS